MWNHKINQSTTTRRNFLKTIGIGTAISGLSYPCMAKNKSSSSRTASSQSRNNPMNKQYKLQSIANYHCKTGENPLWDHQRQLLYWTDIPNGRLFRYDAKTGKHKQIYSGEPVGGFTLQTDGTLLLFQVNKFSLLQPDGKVQTLISDIDSDMVRFNDVIADPRGRVFAGTIGKKNKGGLYYIDLDGKITNLFKGTGCSNGMGFSPDLRYFYWTCTSTRRIFQFNYHRDTGQLTDRKVLITIPEGQGFPDGLTIDTEGNIWSARWDGHGIYKYSPDGKQIGKIEFPVAKVSSAIFGGPKLDELYVTTAGGSDDAKTPDGTLYRVKVKAKGKPEFRSNIKVG